MKAEEFDQKFDAGEDITQELDLSKAKRHHSGEKTVGSSLTVSDRESVQKIVANQTETLNISRPRRGFTQKPDHTSNL